MGWKDLFKSKATKAEPDPRLRWFGKLPTYADYYSSATDQDWAVEFNEWVLKGYETYLMRQREQPRETRLPSAAAILRLPKSGMTVFASIQDYGGDMRGRPFPLCFYTGVPSVQWPGPTSARVPAGLRVLRDLTDLREAVFHFFNAPGRFEAVFSAREIDLSGVDEQTSDTSWEPAARALSLTQWFDSAKACLKVDDVQAWLRLATAWGDNIARLESDEFEPTLRFPLVMAIPFDVQVTGWLRWLERRMNLEERFVSLFVCKDEAGDTGRLTIVARELMTDDFLLISAHACTLPYIDDLCVLGGNTLSASAEAPSAPTESSGTDSVRAPAHWADFVESAVSK